MAEANRVALVTGATGAIGRAIAARILARPNYHVVVIGRDPNKLRDLVAALDRAEGGGRVRGELVDLSSHEEIRAFSARWSGPIDVLVNNAAVAPRQREETKAGIERTFATNVLGYVWMTEALLTFLRQGAGPRVVNVASYWAGDLDLDDLEFRKRRYDNDLAYRQSKQANRMLTVAWANRLRSDGITVNACHPGDVSSKLSSDLGFGGSESPSQGADTPYWLATSDEVREISGAYFEHGRRAKCRYCDDPDPIERLAQICDGYP